MAENKRVYTFFAPFWLFLLLISPCALAIAAPGWHQVEIIVFARDHLNLSQTEELLELSEQHAKPIELVKYSPSAKDGAEASFSQLPESALGLNQELSRLLLTNKYQILLHLGWRQPISSNQRVRPVHFVGGERYAADGSWQVDGLVWLKKNAGYYSVTLNTLLTQPMGATQAANQSISNRLLYRVQLQQQQRSRGKELLYFDHPQFGVLLKLSPYNSTSAG